MVVLEPARTDKIRTTLHNHKTIKFIADDNIIALEPLPHLLLINFANVFLRKRTDKLSALDTQTQSIILHLSNVKPKAIDANILHRNIINIARKKAHPLFPSNKHRLIKPLRVSAELVNYKFQENLHFPSHHNTFNLLHIKLPTSDSSGA